MTRFASAPWPLKAAYVGTLATAGVALLGGLTALIALAGLKRLSPDIDPAQIPAWFWYFREDPLVRRWVGVGLLSTLGGAGLITIGIVLFGLVVAFTLITLPVEFDASRRAVRMLSSGGYVDKEEEAGVRAVLRAAAMTYVAAALGAVLQLARLILLSRGSSRRRD